MSEKARDRNMWGAIFSVVVLMAVVLLMDHVVSPSKDLGTDFYFTLVNGCKIEVSGNVSLEASSPEYFAFVPETSKAKEPLGATLADVAGKKTYFECKAQVTEGKWRIVSRKEVSVHITAEKPLEIKRHENGWLMFSKCISTVIVGFVLWLLGLAWMEGEK